MVQMRRSIQERSSRQEDRGRRIVGVRGYGAEARLVPIVLRRVLLMRSSVQLEGNYIGSRASTCIAVKRGGCEPILAINYLK